MYQLILRTTLHWFAHPAGYYHQGGQLLRQSDSCAVALQLLSGQLESGSLDPGLSAPDLWQGVAVDFELLKALLVALLRNEALRYTIWANPAVALGWMRGLELPRALTWPSACGFLWNLDPRVVLEMATRVPRDTGLDDAVHELVVVHAGEEGVRKLPGAAIKLLYRGQVPMRNVGGLHTWAHVGIADGL